jgi:hypothetical protein
MSEILKGDQQEQSQMALTKICELAAPPPGQERNLGGAHALRHDLLYWSIASQKYKI